MKIGREFYSGKLGFVVRSERYLPAALPLGHGDNSFGFMLHYREGINSIKSMYPEKRAFFTMVFKTRNLKKTLKELVTRNVKIVDKKRTRKNHLQAILIEDPFGNVSEIIESD